MFSEYIYKNQQKLRLGYTTGTCAAAAGAGAAAILFSGKLQDTVSLTTPAGIPLTLELIEIRRTDNAVSCGVKKDAGDDADATDGIVIYAQVSFHAPPNADTKNSLIPESGFPRVYITGGTGIGIVTKDGLEQPKGSYAINSTPRRMIAQSIRQLAADYGIRQDIYVSVSAPAGAEIASKTFNPRLGIEGGISILGTSGIVEPMSERAMLDTIHLELKQRAALSGTQTPLLLTPGNYGKNFVRETWGINLENGVKCSNYIGDTLDMAQELGFQKILLAGHIGKLVKCASGVMNTHSRIADARMETLCSCAVLADVPGSTAKKLLSCSTTDEAVKLLTDTDCLRQTMQVMLDRILLHLQNRTGGRISFEVVVFSNIFGVLAISENALQYIHMLQKGDFT